jgi:glucokinase
MQAEATTHRAEAPASGTPGRIEPTKAPLVESRAATRAAQGATDPVPPGYPALGVAITATSVQASVVNSDGAILANTRRDIEAPATREAALALAVEVAREIFDGVMESHEVTSLGLALDGCPDAKGETAHPPAGVSAWGTLEPLECLAQELALPTAAITASDAAAFAEFSFGAAGGISDTLHVRVGGDIELALLARGSPLATAQGLPVNGAHVVIDGDGPQCTCGESGCWQALASTGALVARAVNAVRGGAASAISAAVDGQLADVTPSLVVRMAAAGDPVARRALQETARYAGPREYDCPFRPPGRCY